MDRVERMILLEMQQADGRQQRLGRLFFQGSPQGAVLFAADRVAPGKQNRQYQQNCRYETSEGADSPHSAGWLQG